MQLTNKVPLFSDLKNLFPKLKAVMWDLDGTIMMTEILHANAYKNIIDSEIVESANTVELYELEQKCIGQTDPVIFNQVKELGFLKDYCQETFLDYKNKVMRTEIKKIKPETIIHNDIIKLITELSEAGVKQAVVTSSEKDTAHALLEFSGIIENFEFVLTRSDTKKNKPSPEPYTVAMEKLSLNPDECLIFEDSNVGMEAAKASRANTIPARWYY